MKITLLAALVLSMTACSPGSSGSVATKDETIGAEVARDYNNAMNKARNVENLTFESKDRTDAALDEAEGATRQKP